MQTIVVTCTGTDGYWMYRDQFIRLYKCCTPEILIILHLNYILIKTNEKKAFPNIYHVGAYSVRNSKKIIMTKFPQLHSDASMSHMGSGYFSNFMR